MNKLSQALMHKMMNEEKNLAELKKALGFKKIRKINSFWLKNAVITVSLMSLILFGSVYDQMIKNYHPLDTATSIVAIDINPSFTLRVDPNGLVLQVTTENTDAQNITVSDLIGSNTSIVIETLILRAQEAGFLIDPTQSNYVLVTTAPVKKGDEVLTDHLNALIQNDLNKEGLSDDVNIAVIKATFQQWLTASKKYISLGLFIINGLVNSNGAVMSISDFLKTNGNLTLLENISQIIKKTTANTKSLLERFLDRLQRAGVDITSFRARLASDNENLAVLKADVLALWMTLKPDTQAGTSLIVSDSTAMVSTINTLLTQLKTLGIDISGYEAYLTIQNPDLLGLEKELTTLLNGSVPDTQAGSTTTIATKAALNTSLNALISQLKLMGVNVTSYVTALQQTNPDYLALETALKKALASQGVDTTTGSTTTGTTNRESNDKTDIKEKEDDSHEVDD